MISVLSNPAPRHAHPLQWDMIKTEDYSIIMKAVRKKQSLKKWCDGKNQKFTNRLHQELIFHHKLFHLISDVNISIRTSHIGFISALQGWCHRPNTLSAQFPSSSIQSSFNWLGKPIYQISLVLNEMFQVIIKWMKTTENRLDLLSQTKKVYTYIYIHT